MAPTHHQATRVCHTTITTTIVQPTHTTTPAMVVQAPAAPTMPIVTTTRTTIAAQGHTHTYPTTTNHEEKLKKQN